MQRMTSLSSKHRNFFLILAVISLVGLLLRGIVCCQLASSPEVMNPNPQSDMATYLRLASDIRHGQFPDHYDYQPFYYTVVLPLVVPDSGSKFWLLALQTIIGAGTVYLCGLCAAIVFGRVYGWVAAALLALARFHVFYTPFALYEVLQSFWIALLCYLTLRAWQHNRLRQWLMSAVVLACAILTRGNALLFLPVVLAVFIIRNRKEKCLKMLGICAAIIAISYLPQLPFAIRNYHYAGRWTGASTAAGKVLILGNSPEAPAAGLAYPLTYSIWTSQSDSGQRSALSNIMQWALNSPLAFIELKFRTLLHFWDSDEIPNNVNIQAHGYPYSRLLSMPFFLDFALFASLGLAGLLLIMRRRSHGGQRLIASFVIMFMLATIAFYMLARFRIAIIPLLCVLAAGTIRNLATIRKMPRRQAVITIVTLLVAIIIVNCVLFLYRYGYESSVIAAISPEGICVHSPDNTVLVHDHGAVPMGVGGISSILNDTPPDSICIKKQFVIPKELRGRLEGRPFQARILTLNPKDTAIGQITVIHGNDRKMPEIKTYYAFSQFLCADFDKLNVADDGTASVLFVFTPSQATFAAVDMLRDFGRTVVTCGGQQVPVNGEAFAELEIKGGTPGNPSLAESKE
ncbi:MAG: glycosyltransferase family 39 protein [Victivallales bacterium]|nr:glycosyltransferase family 39 protein [Victivallales bacterium]